MRTTTRVLLATLIGALALGSVAVAAGPPMVAVTLPATTVADTSATLNAQVVNAAGASLVFEYGPTAAYGESTDPVTVASGGTQQLSAPVEGLAPGTTYHVRAVLDAAGAVTRGTDQTFTTGAPGGGHAAQPLVPDPSGGTPVSGAVLGSRVVVAPSAGTVRVKAPGAAGFAELEAGDALPVGSLVDAREGTVRLTTALADGGAQSGEFRGAVFQVRQSSHDGMTDIVLRGGELRGCGRATARAASRSRRPHVRRLWAHDDGGRFRTHGRNSVATVRGTTWITTDTCAGTRTTVTDGAVDVRDRGARRTVRVRAGRSHLAPAVRR